MLAESNGGPWNDDLIENAIQIEDGGDGIINGADYILFYASGPHEWIKDSINQRFIHKKNIYSERSYYFLSIGANGKRIPSLSAGTGAVVVNSFSERYFYELDSLNFLGSGKQWYGEEFADAPGKSLTRNFNVNLPNLLSGSPLYFQTNLIARSAGTGSRFDIAINNNPVGQVLINPVCVVQYDHFAQE